jgi:hypothetical protein
MTHLGAFQRVDQTALADIREANNADGEALGRAQFVRLVEAEECRRGSRGEVRALVRAHRAEGECWGCMAEAFESCLRILARHQIYKHAREVPHDVDDQRGAESVLRRCTRIYFVGNEHETLPLRFAPSRLLLYQPAATPSRIVRVENEDDDVGLVDDFVQHADVMLPQLFLRLAGLRVDSDSAEMRSLADVDAGSCASEESVGSDAIIASSCGGTCGGDWDGDAPRAEGVLMIGK